MRRRHLLLGLGLAIFAVSVMLMVAALRREERVFVVRDGGDLRGDVITGDVQNRVSAFMVSHGYESLGDYWVKSVDGVNNMRFSIKLTIEEGKYLLECKLVMNQSGWQRWIGATDSEAPDRLKREALYLSDTLDGRLTTNLEP